MKRLLIILLLFFVPLQAGLGSVCGYCAHADAAGDPHAISHGAAKMQQTGANADTTAAGDVGSSGECALCHLGCGTMVAAEVMLPVADPPAAPLPHQPSAYAASHVDRIDRVPLPAACSY